MSVGKLGKYSHDKLQNSMLGIISRNVIDLESIGDVLDYARFVVDSAKGIYGTGSYKFSMNKDDFFELYYVKDIANKILGMKNVHEEYNELEGEAENASPERVFDIYTKDITNCAGSKALQLVKDVEGLLKRYPNAKRVYIQTFFRESKKIAKRVLEMERNEDV